MKRNLLLVTVTMLLAATSCTASNNGANIAPVIGGAGMAIPEMTMLASIFKKKLVAMIVLAIFLTAVVSGYLFNILL